MTDDLLLLFDVLSLVSLAALFGHVLSEALLRLLRVRVWFAPLLGVGCTVFGSLAALGSLPLFRLRRLLLERIPSLRAVEIAAALWCTGALLLLIRHGVRRRRMSATHRRLRPVDDPVFIRACALYGMDSVPLLEAAGAGAYVFRRCVILPAHFRERYEPADRCAVYLHELAHIRGAHGVWLEAAAVLRCLLWPFFPLCWQLSRLSLTLEAWCDREAVRRGVSRDRYARLLLSLCGGEAPAFSRSFRMLRARIEALSPPADTARRSLALLCLLLGLCSPLLASAHSLPPPEGERLLFVDSAGSLHTLPFPEDGDVRPLLRAHPEAVNPCRYAIVWEGIFGVFGHSESLPES